MANSYFKFKQFKITQSDNVFRVGTDGVLLGAWTNTEGVSSVLDVGTGTGLIALMIAQRLPEVAIVAIEPSYESFTCASENVKNSPWGSLITLKNQSLRDYDNDNNDVFFDLIVSNPPFFENSLTNPDQEKARFRHAFSLPAEEIISFSARRLSANGRLSIILPYAEGNVFVATASFAGLYCSRMTRVRPLKSSHPNRLLLEFKRQHEQPVTKILTIGHPDHGGYTLDYVELTKEFYLNF
jgi:tRNA1Val (adenine37-N6)-methyltransferase